MVTLIAAIAENNALGKEQSLLWHLPDDFKRFKALTSNHTIVMGRKTFETLPKRLPDRKHIIITRQKTYKAEGCIVVSSIEEALSGATKEQEVFVIGGGEIYTLALPYADKIELTRVYQSFEGDAFFPELDWSEWKLVQKQFHSKDSRHVHDFSFLTYVRN